MLSTDCTVHQCPENEYLYGWLVDLGFNIQPTAKVVWRWDLGFVSSDRLEKPGNLSETTGLQGELHYHCATEASTRLEYLFI